MFSRRLIEYPRSINDTSSHQKVTPQFGASLALKSPQKVTPQFGASLALKSPQK